MSSSETPRHFTNAMAPFSRTPLNLTIYLFIAVLSEFWRSCRNFFPRQAWRTRESFGSTQGTTPTHTLQTLRLVWFGSFFFAGWVTNGSSHVLAVQHPRPPYPRPLSAPASTSRVTISLLRVLFRRQGCPQTAHCTLYLASLDFDGHGL